MSYSACRLGPSVSYWFQCCHSMRALMEMFHKNTANQLNKFTKALTSFKYGGCQNGFLYSRATCSVLYCLIGDTQPPKSYFGAGIAKTLTEASMSRQPARNVGWLATRPTGRPSRRANPTMMFRAWSGAISNSSSSSTIDSSTSLQTRPTTNSRTGHSSKRVQGLKLHVSPA
jgi:hypothetical protein